jgi:hypothetical protein
MFGIDHQTLAKMEKAEQMPSPVKLGNKLFYERDLIERQILATCRV